MRNTEKNKNTNEGHRTSTNVFGRTFVENAFAFDLSSTSNEGVGTNGFGLLNIRWLCNLVDILNIQGKLQVSQRTILTSTLGEGTKCQPFDVTTRSLTLNQGQLVRPQYALTESQTTKRSFVIRWLIFA